MLACTWVFVNIFLSNFVVMSTVISVKLNNLILVSEARTLIQGHNVIKQPEFGQWFITQGG